MLSELATTFPVAVLESGMLRVRDVTAATVSQTLPPILVFRFLELVRSVDELLLEVTEPVRQRLIEELGGADLAGMMAGGSRPDVIEATDADVNPRTKRLPHPAAIKLHWSASAITGD